MTQVIVFISFIYKYIIPLLFLSLCFSASKY